MRKYLYSDVENTTEIIERTFEKQEPPFFTKIYFQNKIAII